MDGLKSSLVQPEVLTDHREGLPVRGEMSYGERLQHNRRHHTRGKALDDIPASPLVAPQLISVNRVGFAAATVFPVAPLASVLEQLILAEPASSEAWEGSASECSVAPRLAHRGHELPMY